MEEPDKKQKTIQRTTLAVVMITNFVNPFAGTAVNIAVPHIGTEFHVSTTSLTWIVLSYILVSAVLSLPFGRIADIRGRKLILKTGILLLCLAAFATIFSPNIEVFFLSRVFQGIGAAMIFATNSAILVEAFPAERRGSVLGISVAAVFIGSSTGPALGGLLTHAFGWRGVFAAIAVFALTAFIIAMIRLPKETKAPVTQKLSTGSIVLYILSLGLILFGVSSLSQNPWAWVVLAAGVVLIVLFAKHESRTEVPVLEVNVFKGNRLFILSNLVALLNFAATFAVVYWLSLYLQLARGLSADMAGVVMISQPIVQAALSPVAGRLSDRKSPATIASIGLAGCTAALAMFTFINGQTPLLYVIGGLLLTGFGVAFFSSPNGNVIYSSVTNREYGVAASVMSTARTVGQVLGMAIIAIIVSAVIGDMPVANVAPGAIVENVQITFLVFAVICGAGFVLSLVRRNSR